MIIRKEKSSDVDAITEVTVAAFKNHPISQHTEQFIIQALRDAGVLTLSLVAEIDERIVGHVAFSPVVIRPKRNSEGTTDSTLNWFGLGPVSVLPEYQKQGIGSALIREGLSRIKELGGQGCCLVGNSNYYQRFGFRNYPELIYEGIPQEFFLALPFTETIPKGIVLFHEGFSATH